MIRIKLEKKFKSIIMTVILILSGILITINSNLNTQIAMCESTWNQTSDKDFNNNGTFNNITVVGNGEAAKLQIDLSGIQQWKKRSSGNSPSARYLHAMASIWGEDKALIYSGYWSNDTWEYDLSNDTWTDKTTSNNPGNRYYAEMASVFGDNKVVLFGGNMGSDDTWVYNSSTGSWTDVSKSIRPPGRYIHEMSMVYGDDKVVLFGGTVITTSWLNDTWVYDLSDGTWAEKKSSSTPTRRGAHAMAPIFGTSKVLLFGGLTASYQWLHDTWVYDVDTNTWANKDPPLPRPNARSFHSMASIYGDDKVVLFGGMTTLWGNYLDDNWVYDLSDNAWTRIKLRYPSNKPGPRACSGLATIYQKDRTVLFGGMTTGRPPGTQLNDTWIFQYSLPLKNGTFISTPYDIVYRSSFKNLSWYTETPDNSTIKLQLRSADNDSVLLTQDFVGPDGITSTYYTSSPSEIWPGHDADRWIQYKAYFNITEVTVSPSLKDVTITYNCLPETDVNGPSNGSLLSINKPVFKWTFSDYDSDNQKAFQILIDDDINFTDVDFDSSEQFTPYQHWEFPLGTNYSELPDGTWYWKVRTRDEDNEWTEFTSPWMIKIDTYAPTSVLDIPIHNGFYYGLPGISGIAYDAISGSELNKIEILINRLTDNNYWNGTAWVPSISWVLATGTTKWTFDSSNVLWTSGIKYSVQSRASDNASNIEQPEVMNIFTIDKEIPLSKIEIPTDNNWLNKLKSISGNAFDIGGSAVKEVKISIKCTKDFAPGNGGAKKNEYWDDNKWTKKESWLLATGTQTWSYNTSKISLKTGDHYTIRSRATDIISNMETTGTKTTFMYDATPPENLGIYINNNVEEYTTTTGVVLSLTAEDIGSGISQMSFSTDDLIWSTWETFNSSRSFDLPTGDGEKTVYFRVRDHIGNIAEPVSDSIYLDTTPPQSLSVTINEGEKYTESEQVKLVLKAIDMDSGISEMTYSLDGINWQPWEDFKDTKHISLTPGDGKKIVYFKANDKVGNIAEPVAESIILDTTPPYSLSIVINNGAPETNSTNVNLKLNAIDNTSGVSQVSFSTDGSTWSAWEPFNYESSFTFPPNNGAKTVFFRAQDNAGNIGKPVHNSIFLNITTPEKELKTIKTPAAGNESWIFTILIMIILTILVLIIVVLAMVVRKKKHVEQELLLLKAITVKPEALTGTVISPASTRISTVPVQAQLPAIGAASVPQQPTVQTAPAPAVPPKPISATPQLPLLPPAQADEAKLEVQDTTPTPVPMVVTPQPQVSQQSVKPEILEQVQDVPQASLIKVKPQENQKKEVILNDPNKA